MWKITWDVLKDVADVTDVEDCISEVFYKLWKSPELLDPDKGNLKGYLAKMTRNTAIDFCRKKSREKTETLDESDLGDRSDDILDVVILNEEKAALYSIMETMDERDRELINRRYFEGQKPAQISEEMQMPLREVGNRLYRIKGSIRRQIQ